MAFNKLGLFLGCLGGIVSIIGLAIYYDKSIAAVTVLGALLLMAAMFFGLAGGFTSYSQWTPKALTMFAFLTAAIALIVTLLDYVDACFGAVEIIFAVLLIAIAYIQKPATN